MEIFSINREFYFILINLIDFDRFIELNYSDYNSSKWKQILRWQILCLFIKQFRSSERVFFQNRAVTIRIILIVRIHWIVPQWILIQNENIIFFPFVVFD